MFPSQITPQILFWRWAADEELGKIHLKSKVKRLLFREQDTGAEIAGLELENGSRISGDKVLNCAEDFLSVRSSTGNGLSDGKRKEDMRQRLFFLRWCPW